MFFKAVFSLAISVISLSVFSQQILESPDFTLADTDGNVYNLYEELDDGKIVFLYFFDVYCAHCATSVPDLNEIWQHYGSNGEEIWIWGIELLEEFNNETVAEWGETYNVEFPLFSIGHATNVPQLYDITYSPQLHIVCPNRNRAFIQSDQYGNYEFFVSECSNTNIDEYKTSEFVSYNSNGISISNVISKTVNIDIYDVTGRKVFSKILNPSESQSIDLPNNEAIYLISIRNKETIYLQSKISITQ
jgi:peroxiredoxin